MLCEKCKKNNATSIFKQTINGKSTTLHLCSECASSILNTNLFSDFGINNFFGSGAGLFKGTDKRCAKCNTGLDEITKGIIGCDECYSTFADELFGTIEQMHGKSTHIGKRPKNILNSSLTYVEDNNSEIQKPKEENTKLDELAENKALLKKLIENEEFEKAAEIRDKIKELEGGGQKDD